MARLTIKAQIAALHAKGWSAAAIAEKIDRTHGHVSRVIWELRNPKAQRAKRKRYDAARYGTEAYRKADRDYRRWRYQTDPEFRRRRNEAVARVKTNRRESASHI